MNLFKVLNFETNWKATNIWGFQDKFKIFPNLDWKDDVIGFISGTVY